MDLMSPANQSCHTHSVNVLQLIHVKLIFCFMSMTVVGSELDDQIIFVNVCMTIIKVSGHMAGTAQCIIELKIACNY